MPRKEKYKRTTNRQSWSEESMALAIEAMLNGTMGSKKASCSYNVPQTTLEDRVKKARQSNLPPQVAAKKGMGRFKPVFTDAQEKEIVNHVVALEERLFGVTMTELREIAFQLAEKNNISHNFNKLEKMAGKEWLYSFLERHPQLRLRNPEKTSLARAKGFNRTAVGKFFNLLQSVYDKYNFSPCDIYNVDETGILTVPNKPSKILAQKGRKQVGCLSSAERGVLVTVEACMNAAGNFMPPMFVFPRAKANPLLMDDAPPGSFATYNKSGWISTETFLVWFKRFVEFAHPSKEKPVLLLLDGHKSHTKSIPLINAARENNVIILCFPPHTSHRLQPLDVSFMFPLSAYYEQEVRKWLFNNPGRAVTIYQIGKLFRSAYLRGAVAQTAIKGFEKTGIYPFNSDVFPDHLFAPSETTERPMAVEVEENPMEEQRDEELPDEERGNLSDKETEYLSDKENKTLPQNQSTLTSYAPLLVQVDVHEQPKIVDYQQPSTSQCHGQTFMSPFSVSPKDVKPLPVQSGPRATNKYDKRRGKTAIITSSPYKLELEQEENDRMEKQQKKGGALKRKIYKVTGKDKPAKDKKKSKVTKKEPKVIEKGQKIIKKKQINREPMTSDEEDSEGNDEACLFCNGLYAESKSKEGWIQCLQCKRWAHEACSNADEEDQSFICDFCE